MLKTKETELTVSQDNDFKFLEKLHDIMLSIGKKHN